MLDSEAGRRIKQFLRAKLAGIGRKCWQAILENHDQIAADKIKNHVAAQKVGMMLNRLTRGMLHRVYDSFVRYARDQVAQRAAEADMAGKLAMMDDLLKAKLRVFLDAKRLGKMASLFVHWSDVTANREESELMGELEAEDARMRELEQRIDDANAALAGQGMHTNTLTDKLRELEQQHSAELKKQEDVQAQVERSNRLTAEQQHNLADAKALNADDQANIAELQRQLRAIEGESDALKAELHGIGTEVGYMHEESHTEVAGLEGPANPRGDLWDKMRSPEDREEMTRNKFNQRK